MSHWKAAIPILRKTKVKTEIAVLIDSEAKSALPGFGKMANKRGYTCLGVIPGFFDRKDGAGDALFKELSTCQLFVGARLPAEPTVDCEYGFAFSPSIENAPVTMWEEGALYENSVLIKDNKVMDI